MNAKTRIDNPFFVHQCDNYDGSILAIFPKDKSVNISKAASVFNRIDWGMFSMKVGSRYMFKQRLLENCFLTKKQYEECLFLDNRHR